MGAAEWWLQRRNADSSLRGRARVSACGGGRDAAGQPIPFRPDPLRSPSLKWLPGGYMSAGYDTGRER